jgi:isopropylmalate/homocitrate/citramalate synthase
MTRIELRDVCPRDGLQDLDQPIPTSVKAELVQQLHAAGLRSIEVTSFVSPKAIPQLADAADLSALIPGDTLPGTLRSAFVATQGGLERALAAGIDEISTTIPATDGMTQANFRRDRDQMLEEVIAMRAGLDAGTPASITIAVAFGCPFDGVVSPEQVLGLAERLAEGGYDRILLGDTIGVGDPRQVSTIYRLLRSRLDDRVTLGAHFHDPRGAGIANTVAAVEAGATMVDAALGGLGGCPFAPGAAGNIATEDIAWLLHDMGYTFDGDPAAIVDAARWMGEALDLPLRSRTPKARRFDWESDRAERARATLTTEKTTA